MTKRGGLGRGLSALIPGAPEEAPRPGAGEGRPGGGEGRTTLELTVGTGGTLADVSRQLVGDTRAAWELAVLNGMREKDPLRPGQKIKVVSREGKP